MKNFIGPSIWTLLIIIVNVLVDKVITIGAVLPTPKQQLNTQFEEVKMVFKLVNTNTISTVVVGLSVFCVIVIWYGAIKRRLDN
jgi:hypothetical protein